MKLLFYLLILFQLLTGISCRKTDNLLLSDSEILMKGLNAAYTAASGRRLQHSGVNGCSSRETAYDPVFTASGSLEINWDKNKNEYSGNLSTGYDGKTENLSIHGSAYKGSSGECLWIITDSGNDIQSMKYYSVVASTIEALNLDSGSETFRFRVAEVSTDNSGWRERSFRFSRQ